MHTHPRHDAIRAHLSTYEKEGATIRAELADIEFQRKRITENPSIRLVFGINGGSRHLPDFYEREHSGYGKVESKPIVLTAPDTEAPTSAGKIGHSTVDTVATDCAGASNIAYPGLKACLLMWLTQREAHAKAALIAWAGRDAVAEAVAKAHTGSVE